MRELTDQELHEMRLPPGTILPDPPVSADGWKDVVHEGSPLPREGENDLTGRRRPPTQGTTPRSPVSAAPAGVRSPPPEDPYSVPEDGENSSPQEDGPVLGWLEALREHAGNPPAPRQTGVASVIHRRTLREYLLAPVENRIKAQFEQWVRSNAARTITQLEDELGPEEAASYRAAYAADRGAGLYNWEGRHCRTARGDLPGLTYLLFLLLRRCNQDATEELARQLMEEEAGQLRYSLRWALGNSQGPANPPPPPGTGLLQQDIEELTAHLRRRPKTPPTTTPGPRPSW